MSQVSDTVQTFASLPWYDLREVRPATDALWRELARQLRGAGIPEVPAELNRAVSYERQWNSRQFLFGQACGYDVRIAYVDQLQVIATPCYRAPGCSGAHYSSFVVVREDSRFELVSDLRGTRCVINTPTSHSGMNILRALVAPLHSNGRFFSDVRLSGSHEQSLRMIRAAEVDVAAIDCVTYELLRQWRPQELDGCRVLYRTEQVPAPPFVTAADTPPDRLAAMRDAVLATLRDPQLQEVRDALLLAGVEELPLAAYRPIETLEFQARQHNYTEIPGRVRSAG